MSLLSHLKSLRFLCHRAVNTFLLRIVTTMTLAAGVLKKVAPWLAASLETVPQHRTLCPIHLLLAVILLVITTTVCLALRRRAVYLVNYACFRPSSNLRLTKATFLEHAHLSPLFDDSTVNFIATILERSGMSDQTCAPPVHHYIEPYCRLDEARAEGELVVFSVIDDLMAKTRINSDAIGALITNCSAFSPVPSMADMIVNRYKLRGDLRVINLSGMACSAAVTSVGLASNMLQVMPWGSHVLVVSTETIGPSYYAGNKRSMQLVNILFRIGGAAKLLSTSKSKARFHLGHFTRTITAANNAAYRCVYQEEDDKGNLGIALSKDLMDVARDALKDNIMTTGPLVLPASELLKFLFFYVAKKVLRWRKIRPYIPNFCVAFEHFCIHVGGPAVIASVQRGLNLSDKHVEASKMTLHRFGNQSTSSVWYELSYIEAKGRMKKGDRVWMIGFGAGYECNTVGWVCIQPSSRMDGPWASCIHRYPVDVSKSG
ncbi:3-ketoacyl-CoA synthase 5-like [Aegilops tauschii subsp. strangulata]|uniref:3-ketoacyl-CoA synthase n=2 Tax=Aegilops tauschii TaxID=37682 RepID=A0A453QPZ8_AEGTS|nr:3-ketoacyl-CoA synthase 6-like [Aegilops tauschii subsp. strangulata]